MCYIFLKDGGENVAISKESKKGTFSNFDRYADYDKGDAKATLKNIKKKLIG